MSATRDQTSAAPEAAALGVVLSGGLARRMGGGDKCLAPLGGSTLLAHVIARLEPQVAELALNANGDPERFRAPGHVGPETIIAPDSVPGFVGPLAGVLAGMELAAARGLPYVVTAAADTPFFPRDLAARLAAAAAAAGTPLACAASPDAEGRLWDHPTFGWWPAALADDLRRALAEEGLRKIVRWTDRRGCARARFEPGPGGDPFFNVNTPEDLAAAEAIARGDAAPAS